MPLWVVLSVLRWVLWVKLWVPLWAPLSQAKVSLKVSLAKVSLTVLAMANQGRQGKASTLMMSRNSLMSTPYHW